MLVERKSKQMAIDNIPEQMSSPIDNPAQLTEKDKIFDNNNKLPN